MDIRILEQEEGIEQLVELAIRRKLIPFFGAGFTMGCAAFRRKTPGGKEAVKIMNKIILNYNKGKISEDELSDNFQETAGLFFSSVSKKERDHFFRDYFVNVDIEDYKENFLKIDWPYAYTINIDDAIERTKAFNAILPYKELNHNYNGLKCLYKLHGDANQEITYVERENIVFNATQYINSIKSEHNKDFLNNLISDYSQNNIVFIGCSMENEPDLKFIFEQVLKKGDNIRAVIRDEKPSFKQEKQLIAHGINEVILVKDYELFYKAFFKKYNDKNSKIQMNEYKFIDKKIKYIEDNREMTIKYFSGINIFEDNENVFYKSGMHIIRSCLKDVFKQLKSNNCVIIKGRRFSGKTYLLCNICEYESALQTYYFPSYTQIDCYFMKQLLQEKNCLFMFDSNSISPDVFRLLSSSGTTINKNNNKIIIATNTNENYIIGVLDAGLVELDSRFDKDELNEIRSKADKYALIQRRRNQTNLDYLQVLSNEQKIDVPTLKLFPENVDLKELVMLFLLAANDKIYYSDLIALEIMPDEINEFLKRYKVLVEEIPTERKEKERHSATKLIHNSKMILLNLIKSVDRTDIVSAIKYIVVKLKNDVCRERVYINVILFDTLNQIFGGKNGAAYLIFDVYESLEDTLYDSPDYWLQRAKSIYRSFSYSLANVDKLTDAYQYAKKSYFDGNSSMKLKSALSLSLISAHLYSIVPEEKEDEKITYQIECINKGYEAAFSQYYKKNYRYLNNELRGGKMRMNSYEVIIDACNKASISKLKENIVKRANELKNKLEDLQRKMEER